MVCGDTERDGSLGYSLLLSIYELKQGISLDVISNSDVQRMQDRNTVILTHPVMDSRTLGRAYSWSWKSSDGSQSTWKLLESLLNSTGHTK